jgi:Protein of unknown function (DUF3309)
MLLLPEFSTSVAPYSIGTSDKQKMPNRRSPVGFRGRAQNRACLELTLVALRFVRSEQLSCGAVMLGTILVIILILILIGSLPTWPYSGGWGYYPSGGFGLLLVIVIILLLAGRI